jgi:vacuolar-type H+-ATPase subunit I/STV1
MRGKRYLRPAAKKPKRTKETRPSFTYINKDEGDPAGLAKSLLNAIDHLGTQRFALPPFAEHFQRWLTDLQTLLDEFRIRIPEAADTQFQERAGEILRNLQDDLAKRSQTERSTSGERNKLHQELSQLELDLSKLERAYRSKLNELRFKHDRSNRKLHEEIDTLDKTRLQIIRKKPTILQRITRRPKRRLERTSAELETKKTKLRDDHQTFERTLQNSRNEYEKDREKLLGEIDLLKQKIEARRETEDDALEIRKQACQQIHATIDHAMTKITSTQHTEP